MVKEPWRDRRKRLEDTLAGHELPRVGVVPVTDDAPLLYETWMGWGGEGIVLKDPSSVYRPGVRSTAWLKVKPKLTLPVVVTGGSSEKIAWGDWGTAVHLQMSYVHPRTQASVAIEQTVRVLRELTFELRQGQVGEVVCWGVMPLRHPLFVGWISSVTAASSE